MNLLKKIVRVICLALGLCRAPKNEAPKIIQNGPEQLDWWSEMAARAREDRR